MFFSSYQQSENKNIQEKYAALTVLCNLAPKIKKLDVCIILS